MRVREMLGVYATGAGRARTEGEALDLGRLGASPQLVQPLAARGVPHAHERPALGGGSEARAVDVEREARESRLVGGDEGGACDVEQLDADVALLQPRARQHAVGRVGAERAEATRVGDGLDGVEEVEVGEVVHVDVVLEHDHHALPAHAHGLHLRPE